MNKITLTDKELEYLITLISFDIANMENAIAKMGEGNRFYNKFIKAIKFSIKTRSKLEKYINFTVNHEQDKLEED